jgi:hypothetical protein
MNDKHSSIRIGSADHSIAAIRVAVIAVTATALAGLAGCISPANDRLAVNHIDTFGTDIGVQNPTTDYRPLETIGRREWAPVTYAVPIDSVVHGPTYAPTMEMTDKSARQRGAFPTIETAFEMGEGSLGQRLWEVAAGPFVGMTQGVLAMGLFFIDPQVIGDESPSMAYQRSGPKAKVHPAITQYEADATGETATEK